MRNRKLGARLFPKIAEVILDTSNCYPQIFEAFREHYSLADLPEEIDSRWAVYWALYIGDREIMRDRVTDSDWAYEWARDIGPHPLVTNNTTQG